MTENSKKTSAEDTGIPVLEFDHTEVSMEIERIGAPAADSKAGPAVKSAPAQKAPSEAVSFGDGGFELSFGDDEPVAIAAPENEEDLTQGLADAFGIGETTSAGFTLDGDAPAKTEEIEMSPDLEEDLEMFNSTRSGMIIPKELLSESIEFNPIPEKEASHATQATGPMVVDIAAEAPSKKSEASDGLDFSLSDDSFANAPPILPNIQKSPDPEGISFGEEEAPPIEKKKVEEREDTNAEIVEFPMHPPRKAVPVANDEAYDAHTRSMVHVNDLKGDLETQTALRQMREEREDLIKQIKGFKVNTKELEQDNLTLQAALDESKIEITILRKRYLSELEDVKYRLSISEDKKILADERTKALAVQKEKLEQKVRIDLNLVKQREKELETRLEMMAMDVDAQVQSRDQKILELRRKIDSLEFNMENVSIREQKTSEDKRKIEDKLNKIMKTLRNSIKNLEDDIDTDKVIMKETQAGKNK